MPDGYSPARETGLYYLQSRYYNPTWGRFLNADSTVSTGQGFTGNNMFVYCGNNPVCRIDSSGCAWVRLAFLSWFVGLIKELEASRVYEYIIDQDANGVGDLTLGVTTVSHGGCGVIASYNALITLGDAKSFKSV